MIRKLPSGQYRLYSRKKASMALEVLDGSFVLDRYRARTQRPEIRRSWLEPVDVINTNPQLRQLLKR